MENIRGKTSHSHLNKSKPLNKPANVFLGIDLGTSLTPHEFMRRVREAEILGRRRKALEQAGTKPILAPALITSGSVVYFLQDGDDGPVKIGTTGDLSKRIRAIRAASGRALIARRVLPGGRDVEAYYHRVFRHLRTHGEWFRHEGDLAAYLAIT